MVNIPLRCIDVWGCDISSSICVSRVTTWCRPLFSRAFKNPVGFIECSRTYSRAPQTPSHLLLKKSLIHLQIFLKSGFFAFSQLPSVEQESLHCILLLFPVTWDYHECLNRYNNYLITYWWCFLSCVAQVFTLQMRGWIRRKAQKELTAISYNQNPHLQIYLLIFFLLNSINLVKYSSGKEVGVNSAELHFPLEWQDSAHCNYSSWFYSTVVPSGNCLQNWGRTSVDEHVIMWGSASLVRLQLLLVSNKTRTLFTPNQTM